MISPRPHDSRLISCGYSFGIAVPLLPSFAAAFDIVFAILLSMAVLVAVCLLWHKKSPRHQFVLDLMTAESETEKSTGLLPEEKMHPDIFRRSA